MLSLFPAPIAHAEESGGTDGGTGGTSTSNTYVTVNGGQNTLGSADSVDVSTSVTNITADNVTVYVEGGYNPTYLYHPRVTELHLANNANGALWNPTTKEIPTTLHAAVMRQAGVAILYDGWIDLDSKGPAKPDGATRAGEILGYDIYAKLGEQYALLPGAAGRSPAYAYSNGGLFTNKEAVNYTWALMQLYRAVGVEQTEYFVLTESAPEDFDINRSPLSQFLTMATSGPDLSAAISTVSVTRTNPDTYLKLAETDGIAAFPDTDRESQRLTVGEFCALAHNLMQLYGEPVLTEQETYMLLQAYGRELPYGLPGIQLEAVKYLLARGVIECDMDWRADITFEDATTLLLRIKDEGSRLTFKEIQLTMDVGLLEKGYYPTEVSTYQSPIEVVDETLSYDAYNDFDYFVEVVDTVAFRSGNGYSALPFLCAGEDNVAGVLKGTRYMGRVSIKGRTFYHFSVDQTLDTLVVGSGVYVNTVLSADSPAKYRLPSPGKGNDGGYWLYTGGAQPDAPVDDKTTVSSWKWFALDGGALDFPSEYCDYARKDATKGRTTTQLGLFDKSSYGFTVRVDPGDLSKVSYVDAAGISQTLESIPVDGSVKEKGGRTIHNDGTKTATGRYYYFLIEGCDKKSSLAEILSCADDKNVYTTFPAFSQNGDQHLVSIDYLKSIGAVWEFTKTSDTTYYIGVKTLDGYGGSGWSVQPTYTDVYIGTAGSSSYVIRGTQLTLYPRSSAVVWETDGTHYVDYEALLGIQTAVSFKSGTGGVSLSRGSQLQAVSRTYVTTVNNKIGEAASEIIDMPTALVKDANGKNTTYIYAPGSYVLANWLVVDNRIDGSSGVFSFFASDSANPNGVGANMLRSMLGVETSGTGWEVFFRPITPMDHMLVTEEGSTLSYKKGPLPDILYVKSLGAYLIKPHALEATTTYGDWIQSVRDIDSADDNALAPLTSIISKRSDNLPFAKTDYIADWNYNLYTKKGSTSEQEWVPGYAIHKYWSGSQKTSSVNGFCDMSGWTGNPDVLHSAVCSNSGGYWSEWVPGPVGVPGLLGYPIATSSTLSRSESVDTYSGIAFVIRRGAGAAVTAAINESGESNPSEVLKYSVIHATPSKLWLQSCGFTFTFLQNSPLNPDIPTAPDITGTGAVAGFDWEQFFKDVGLQNADDWLTIAIIAILNILPRIFMFAFILLMGLSLIAEVKPWQAFCDNVFDPYRLLTLGRKDVHTIKLKMVFLYSMIAIALFGMFQNGLILNVIAWVARAVTGILSR